MTKKRRFTVPNIAPHTPLRDEFEIYYAEEIRPSESKRMADAFDGHTDDQSLEALDAWENFLDGEFKECYWEKYEQGVTAVLNENGKRIKTLESDLDRLSYDIGESAMQVLKLFSDDSLAICIYFLNHMGFSQREISGKVKCSLGTVNARIKKLEAGMGFRMRKPDGKSMVKPPLIAGNPNPNEEYVAVPPDWDQ